ncbi:bifunctional acetyl-CoA hydrolase/transferase family protein/GNAT family N-acetyltransferase [Syntrophobacter fumaroxidans]|uniref:Acetyl-CoA hydrolase/transferase n=1 Tax=Syntrophobacter fumaroxidans (strain DSM 10017 / MPOB) TaxID=335543 RepID=A0LHR8_SYNFM|nr:bifunctional acetyl-CoA hydrolase/transferase family protein/GNAT family N-acetyltransferase [Syntrophobacter fumaroxidans]ABK16970.1 acetyl-CoA hydrolase/transferase [Syntrophobacter fumaroxidans MPOB]
MVFDEHWKTHYRERLDTAKSTLEAAIKDGNRIFIASACGEPQHLVRALVELLPRYRDLELVQNLSVGELPEDWSELKDHCRLKTFFVGPRVRKAVNEGFADYIPTYFSAIPGLIREDNLWAVDICLIQVSPPDEHGFCSLGIAVEITKSAADAAKIVIAQVNPRMPRVLGDSFLHVSQIDHFVEYEEPLIEVVFRERSAITERIAKYVSLLVEDGSTLQVGVGRIVNSVLTYLEDKKDLGVHTEILTDAHLHLVKKGVITGLRKEVHPGRIVTSACTGSADLYSFVHNNPEVEIYPIEYVNDRRLISRHDQMVAINSALEIDLSGQVCSDSIGHTIHSGIGGFVDFTHGAATARHGKSIIVLPSTSTDGRRSRIVSHLASGAGVVSSRSMVRYVVTEFGIAYLHGKTIRERALALINIAHPKFRERLLGEAKRLRYVYDDQILPPIYEPLYPGQWETHRLFPGDRNIFFRPIKPTDERGVQEFFYSLPDQDIYYRFLSAMKVFPHRNTQGMCNIDYEHEMAIVGVTGEIGSETIIGLGRYILDQKTNIAEVDFAVAAEWQRIGIGTFLLHYLCEIAGSKGITGFTAYVLAANRKMLSVFHKVGYFIHTTLEDGVYEISFRFDEPASTCPVDCPP